MASEARINISASDNASKTINSVQGGLRGLAGDAKKSVLMGVGLGAGIGAWNLLGSAVSGVVGYLGDAVVAAKEEETSIAKLDAALAANIEGWEGNTQAIEDRMDAGKDLGFSDDEQRDSLALLVAATGDVDKAFAIMRTGMDLARLKGIDLVTASEALIKVDSGRFRMLANLGIELGENATATEALAAVQAIAAGQAVGYSETTQGALDEMQVKFDDLQEEIGIKFLPTLIKLADWISDDLIPAFELLLEEIEKIDWEAIGEGISGVVDWFVTLWSWVVDVTTAIENFGHSLPGYKPAPGSGNGTFGGGTTFGGAGGSSGFGMNVYLDGRELQSSSAGWERYSGTGNSRFPR